MRLFGKLNSLIDRFDRAEWMTVLFDLPLIHLIIPRTPRNRIIIVEKEKRFMLIDFENRIMDVGYENRMMLIPVEKRVTLIEYAPRIVRISS